jgi:pyruvate carboxylase
MNFEKIRLDLQQKYGTISETDVVSYSQYPKVFEEYMDVKFKYGDLSVLDTRTFVEGQLY